MAREQRAHRLAERARAFAVDQAHVRQTGHERVVEILLDQIARLVGGLAKEHQLGPDAAAARPAVARPRHPHRRGGDLGDRGLAPPQRGDRHAAGDGSLAIAPTDPDTVYALVEAADNQGGIFRSTDRGVTWAKRNPFDQQAQYYAHVVVDPHNKDRIYVMNVFILVSDDGGQSLRPL